ncbi:MAG: DUF938 domain-containing protein [Panacagrimonas sp.]
MASVEILGMNKPFAAACARNRDPILTVLQEHFADRARVLEIGSGTGQHAVHFAAALPHLSWQASDRADNLPGIGQWLQEAALPNTPAPVVFDVEQPRWPTGPFDAIFTANTLHIMGEDEVVTLFRRLPEVLADRAKLVIYGPFNYGGGFTSPSNAAFDASLKAADSRRGIRDFEFIDELAHSVGLSLVEDVTVPANNRCIVWRR